MLCPKCDSDKLVNHTNEVTTKVKFRIVTYMKEKTMCVDCKTEWETPKQLDTNSMSLKKAYQNAVN